MSPHPEKNEDCLLVAVRGKNALVRVRGRGSFKTGPALKRFGMETMAEGCNRFILDMGECVGMDSTFMGVLAGLAMRLKSQAQGRMVVINLNAKTRNLLETLGLGRLIELCRTDTPDDKTGEQPANIADMSQLDPTTPDRRMSLETMLAAHLDLVKACPDNLPEFKDVINCLGENLKRLEDS